MLLGRRLPWDFMQTSSLNYKPRCHPHPNWHINPESPRKPPPRPPSPSDVTQCHPLLLVVPFSYLAQYSATSPGMIVAFGP